MILQFEKLNNTRELGGIKTTGGGEVRPMLLFRTPRLSPASEADIQRLKALGIRHIFDFRDRSELEEHPDPSIDGAVNHFIPVLPALPGKKEMDLSDKTPEILMNFFRSMYKTFAENDVCAGAYREFFRIVIENAGCPILWHCTQGKDRTGIASLLLLTALGVKLEDAKEDYFLSNPGLRPDFEVLEAEGMDGKMLELMRAMMFVYPECLDGFLDSVKDNFGGVEGYLRQRLGLDSSDFDTLRAAYVR